MTRLWDAPNERASSVLDVLRRRTPPAPPDPYGLDLKPGDDHHRAYVGPPEDYDIIAGLSFGVLFATGMRETHRVLDVGCGSLRVGRLLIPYLRPDHYRGIEPNRHLVEQGVRLEVGGDVVKLKRPRFSDVSDFSTAAFDMMFDRVLAQSIFSHTYDDLALQALRSIQRALAPEGLLVATYVKGYSSDGRGWLYPGCTQYQWVHLNDLLCEAGLHGEEMSWPHPRQQWFVAGHHDCADLVRRVGATLSLGFLSPAVARWQIP